MLLVLYMEYVARMKATPHITRLTFSYREWLWDLQSTKDEYGYASFGDMVRDLIDPTWAGA